MANGAPSSSAAPSRSSNDIPTEEPSSDIITNLLTSLSTIPVPSEPDQYSPLIPSRTTSITSPRRTRTGSAQKHQPPTSVFARDAPAVFEDASDSQTASRIGTVSLGVATPPTIKTSRPPSGYSPLTSPKPARRGKSSYNLRGTFAPSSSSPSSAPPSRHQTEPILPRLQEESAPPNKFNRAKKSFEELRRPHALSTKGKRDSLQVARSREAKGKQRVGPASPLYSPLPPQKPLQPRSPYSRAHEPLPQRPYYSEHVSPQRSPVPSVKANDDIETPRATSKSLQDKPSTESFVIIHRKSGDTGQPRSDRRRFIPSRSSSVGRASGVSPRHGRGSTRSSLRSQHQSPETVHEECEEDVEAAVETGQLNQTKDLGLGQESTVVKRIMQLRAAKEQREKSKLSKTPTNIVDDDLKLSTMAPAPLGDRRPDTSSAQKQLEEAETVKRNEVIVKPQSGSTSAEPPSAKTFSSESPVLMSGEYANFSRPKPTLVDGNRNNVGQPPFHDNGAHVRQSSLLSRSSSRAKRWSNPDLRSRKNSIHQHARSGSDNTDIVNSTQNAPVEEQRPSLDSVDESVEGFLGAPRLSQKIPCPKENRVISFSEVGDPEGHAVFCCIGMGLTRYVMAFYEELAMSLKLRLITPERPGIGESDPYEELHVPLHWPDDVRAICNHLAIQSFSLIAHSAGAIYALATALKMPSRVRGRIHLLAPWIPPSQLNTPPMVSTIAGSPARSGGLPKSQRLLRYVPTPLLKLGSASYLGSGVKPAGAKSPPSKKETRSSSETATNSVDPSPRPSMSAKVFGTGILTVPLSSSRPSFDPKSGVSSPKPSTPHLDDMITVPYDDSMTAAVLSAGQTANSTPAKSSSLKQATNPDGAAAWQKRYDSRLTALTWDLATRRGNPAADLIVCLERHGTIGFMYRDVAREAVIHHGSKDSRVPLDNVKWLGTQVMQKCELRVLEGEGHGLMASAGVMAGVLGEVSKEAEMGPDYGNLGDSGSYKSPLLEGGATF